MKKVFLLILSLCTIATFGQKLTLNNQVFELKNVTGSIVDFQGEKASLFINDAKYSTFIVDKMLGKTTHGSIGLWVDIGTIGYFKDLKVFPKEKNAAGKDTPE